ncbi:hypothetical protein BJX70DRAFT_360406 [Aspergillus crustosus]
MFSLPKCTIQSAWIARPRFNEGNCRRVRQWSNLAGDSSAIYSYIEEVNDGASPVFDINAIFRMFSRIFNLVTVTLAIQSLSGLPGVNAASIEPPPPGLSYLYTAFVHCRGTLMNEDGPRGTRRAIPIVGGNFTGPRLSGTYILPLTSGNHPTWTG